jgi:threonine aldolase
MQAIVALCRERGIPAHLDGARLFMMSAATGVAIRDYAALFDSVYVSMYKYFGAPFGAILAGPQEFIEGMYHERRMFGGGLASAYLPAALALQGLDGFEERFTSAIRKAESLFASLNRLAGLEVRRFEHGSNIVELRLGEGIDADRFAAALLEARIIIPWPPREWPAPLLHVNTTILRRPNDEISASFAAALSAAPAPDCVLPEPPANGVDRAAHSGVVRRGAVEK